ncbi:hypothetical protein MKW94_028038 [Papaver nudicaule]|uniref:Uncharacterized protein n=1 Tax=Papaver nudicaule TaxID=74823 RepID=A0AA41SFF3_PAPNU|nr:hypothetical protein [Papaver nudicaule]
MSAALHSLCCAHTTTTTTTSSSSSSLPTQQKTLNNHLSTKPKTSLLLQKIPISSDQVKEKILCLEIMGVDSGKALAVNPFLHEATLDSIHQVIRFLQSKGIQQKDMGRIFGMCPRILTSNIKTDLLPVFQFLSHELNVPSQNYRRVINKNPRLLVSSVRDHLKPTLFYLQRLGFEDLDALAYQDSILLVSSVEKTLLPKLDYLQSIGFSKDDVIGMVLRCPSLFTFSIENNYKPKFGYYMEEMGGSLEELKEFPQYFTFSLEKRIKPRHKEIVRANANASGVGIPLGLMLKSTEDEFRELISKEEML